jgi:hypothetical protein
LDPLKQLTAQDHRLLETIRAHPPRSILMIKSHSMGIGDLLRSSAAWRVMKSAWPEVQLHLLFLSKHEGYPSEELIAEHALLSSAEFVTIQRGNPGLARSKRPKVPFKSVLNRVRAARERVQADWIIDFEASGGRTSALCWLAQRGTKAHTLGINQVLGRSLFYEFCAQSVTSFAAQRGHALPLEYTLRDFVVLSALGLEREGAAIELNVTAKGRSAKSELEQALNTLDGIVNKDVMDQNFGPSRANHSNKALLVGLNIGCGTADAAYKRPEFAHLAQCIHALHCSRACRFVLTGAGNEAEINQAFISTYKSQYPEDRAYMLDFSGRSSLSGLTGVIDACELFISSDSGPYHMSVGLRRPTLVWFTYPEHTSFHEVPWCERVIQPSVQEFMQAVDKLV